MQFFRVTKAVSAVLSVVPRFPSGLSLPLPTPHFHPNSQQQGAAAVWFPCALPYHHWLQIHFRGKGANNSKYSRMP